MTRARHTLTVELALLGLLRAAPRHGYEIYQELTDPAGLWAIWRMKQSQLYAMLAMLEAEGLATATVQPQETARPPRKMFTLTPAGQKAFKHWVRSPVPNPREVRLDFLLKLYFARREGIAVARQLISAQRDLCQSRLAEERAKAKQISDTQTDAWLFSQFRIEQMKALLNWLQTCEKQLSHPIAHR